MIYKPCPPPQDGGSAKGNVRYILGYELGAKREEWEIRNASYHALLLEAQQRADLGVGTSWRPTIGAGIRPSSVLALNVGTLATADVEMQALFQANKRVKSPTHHEMWAFGNDAGLTDEQALEAVRRVYERVGLGNAAMVLAVHRDTFRDDGRVKLHVHAARAAVNPTTLRAYNHHQLNTRIDRAARAVELEMGLFHDRGLAVVDRNDDGTAFVRDSTVPERIAWRRENREERLIALERARYADNVVREGSFERYAEARVEPRLRQALQRAKDAGERVQPIDVANTAARLGTVIQVDEGGHLQLRDVSTARLRERQRAELEQVKVNTAHAKGLVRDEALDALREQHRDELAEEIGRLLTEGEVAPLSPKMEKELRSALRDPRILNDEIAVERAFVDAVDRDPGLVARALTRSHSTFGRDDVDRYLVDRVADVGEVERLAHRVFAEDRNLVLLSADVVAGVWTTKEMLAIEQRIAEDARALAQRADPQFSAQRRADAIARMEAERSTPSAPFRLSDEQRAALSKHGGLVAILGNPGTGKTTLMQAIRMEAEAAGRPVRGVTIAQAAAIRLEVEAGFASVNTTLALLRDNPRKELIPRGGVLIIDEAAMVDSRTMHALLRLAHERETCVVPIGDPRQIQAVGAGGPWHILEKAAREAGTFAELRENRRQRHAWHRDAVSAVSHAIEQQDARTFARAAQILEHNGALEFVPTKDDAISDIVAWYEAERTKPEDVLLVASDRDTVRYLNEELLRRREGRGPERRYLTEGGTRGLAIGDRLIFGENNARLGLAGGRGAPPERGAGVVNGDTGTVTRTGQNMIDVLLDRTGTVVSFDARKYLCWDHGYATTIAKAQGASVRALGGIVDGASTAEAFHVLISRAQDALRVLVPKTALEDVAELGEHLADRIEAKGTTQDLTAELAQHGGPETYYAMNARAQQLSAANPARKEWEAEWTAMRTQRDREIHDLAEAYRMRVEGATPEQTKALRQEQRKAEAAIVKAYQPEDFGVWLHRDREHERGQAQRVSELEQLRVAKQNQAVERAASVEIEFDDDELEEEQEQQHTRSRGIRR